MLKALLAAMLVMGMTTVAVAGKKDKKAKKDKTTHEETAPVEGAAPTEPAPSH